MADVVRMCFPGWIPHAGRLLRSVHRGLSLQDAREIAQEQPQRPSSSAPLLCHAGRACSRRCRVERPQQARLTAALRQARSRRVARTVEFGNSSRPRRWPTQNRGCLARNAVASDRSAASLLHLAEQGPRWSKKRCPSSSAAGVWRLVIETLAGAWLRASRSPFGVGDLLADFDPGSPVAPTARPLSPLGRG